MCHSCLHCTLTGVRSELYDVDQINTTGTVLIGTTVEQCSCFETEVCLFFFIFSFFVHYKSLLLMEFCWAVRGRLCSTIALSDIGVGVSAYSDVPPLFVWLHCADRFTTVLLSYLQNSTMSCERFKSVWCVQVSWVHFDGLWQYCHGVLIVSWSTYNLINDSNPILLSFLVIWHRSESPAHTVYRQKKNHILLFSLLL